ncbi:MAG: transcriptional repressor [Candidatus Methanofastidiosa archaeon]|jgi:Fur family ferric uptake transcriptional regulator|nr:transcriptional repressor [Candidatus Methanofastidiosa archaeon]
MESGKIKYTNQRVEILEYIRNSSIHPTVDDVYRAVKKKLNRISKATVYQNLKFLSEKGIIQEVNIKGVSRFESKVIPHHHLICKNCGRIMDFESKELTEFSLKIIKELNEFHIESTTTNFYGACTICKQNSKKFL